MKTTILLFGFILASFLLSSQTEYISYLKSTYDSIENTALELKNKDKSIINKMLESLKHPSINDKLNKYHHNSLVKTHVIYNKRKKTIDIREYYDEEFIRFMNGYSEDDLNELYSYYEDKWICTDSDFEKYKVSLGSKNEKTKMLLNAAKNYEDSMFYFSDLKIPPKVYIKENKYESYNLNISSGKETIDTLHPYFIMEAGIYDSSYTEFINKEYKSNFHVLSIQLKTEFTLFI